MKTQTEYLSTNRVRRAEGTLAKASGGRKSWEPDTLHVAACQCLLMGKAHEFDGRPHDADEYAAFEKAWRKVQRNMA